MFSNLEHLEHAYNMFSCARHVKECFLSGGCAWSREYRRYIIDRVTPMEEWAHRELRLDASPLTGCGGEGVRIAVVDSGVHPQHPHVGGVAGGVAIGLDGAESTDYLDRLGHGTAVTAAIKEKAPEAELLAVKVFGDRLATSCTALVRAMEWAAEQEARLVNLSLGTANPAHEARLAEAVSLAAEAGSLVVSAQESDGVRWLPGSLPGAIGVRLDWSCARHSVRIADDSEGGPVFLASGFPRPIPGVSPVRNLGGISFAVANVTGVLARLLEREPDVRDAGEVFELARSYAALRPATQ